MNGHDFHVRAEITDDHVAEVEFSSPPNNFFSTPLIRELVSKFQALDANPDVRASVFCSTGRVFCAGADFSSSLEPEDPPGALYFEAARLFRTRKPVVAAVQGPAIGGGLGLALFADFRVAAPEARFAANFARLGIHHGFGLTATLPPLVGQQVALDMLMTGRRIKGEEALALGLCDRLAPLDRVRDEAHILAVELARSAPLAVVAIRETLRGELADRVVAATSHEIAQQLPLMKTVDFAEGVRAAQRREIPDFVGQ